MTFSDSFVFNKKNIVSRIKISSGWLYSNELISFLSKEAKEFYVITDSHVKLLHGDRWCEFLNDHGLKIHLLSIPSGEENKTRESKQNIEDQITSLSPSADICIIAFGGGVVLDLGGFVAATYRKGVKLINIPSSLLGMVDACLGGKVAVNTPFGKNLIGCFYPAHYILIDPSLLSSLPLQLIHDGLSEVIKYGCISHPDIFSLLEKESYDWQILIESACREKIKIVEKDPYDQNLRKVLNYGHTIGHAIEKLSNYRISHGKAVAIGLYVESCLSHELGYLSLEDTLRIHKLILKFHPLIEWNSSPTWKEWQNTLQHDKKKLDTKPCFVLLKKIGRACSFEGRYCTPVPEEILRKVLIKCRYLSEEAV
ncbi:MAG: 3-dehydroquinate synthase [Rhabdochlamydiaceae bacterium]